MIPPLNQAGYLPPGVHVATLQELLDRFGHGSDQREAAAQSLQWLWPLCKRAGILRLLVNGSFVTDRLEPNDVDCVLLEGPDYRAVSSEASELRAGLPFLELKVVQLNEYEFFRDVLFASDRAMIQKGIVELVL